MPACRDNVRVCVTYLDESGNDSLLGPALTLIRQPDNPLQSRLAERLKDKFVFEENRVTAKDVEVTRITIKGKTIFQKEMPMVPLAILRDDDEVVVYLSVDWPQSQDLLSTPKK